MMMAARLISERDDYLELIRRALSQIGPEYFRLLTTYAHSGIVRERMFCYEFYHQIRSSMSPNYQSSLHGEIDKRGHPDFAPEHQRNPDFVFHVPGTHARNMIVIEVKGQLGANSKGIEKDFGTLLAFTGIYQYKAGVFILYNHSLVELKTRLRNKLASLASNPNAGSVSVLCIKDARGPIEETSILLMRP